MPMTPDEITIDDALSAWRRTARSRLWFELSGLSFAIRAGFSPEEYARHLWCQGAARWLGKETTDAGEYLRREAEAFQCFYPRVGFKVVKTGKENAELLFTNGCLGGWGEDRWALAKSLGLDKKDACAYCQAAFRVWAGQLGLKVRLDPQDDETCRMRVTRV